MRIFVRMAQYCSLEEAWGNIPTEDWNSPIGHYNTPKQPKHRKGKQLTMKTEKNTRRNTHAGKDNRTERPSAPSKFTSPVLLQGSNEGDMSLYGPVNFDTKHQTDSVEDTHPNDGGEATEVEVDDASEPGLDEQPAEMSEADLLKNQVSYLTTKVEHLTKVLQENMAKPDVQNRQSSDLILFVAVGLFFILVLDLFFRAGARSSAEF